ncbi:uncharacterized protein LOC123308668 [Coccinella septempunctata]|uniref:uncharacterized protein LOC123308668 n=1 Tax=Coccinella septempunctata TaxID=41139 RepID=UPI001D088C3B|nr:uncharacterized protein LOC123308668 [Coccinella septempunctata]
MKNVQDEKNQLLYGRDLKKIILNLRRLSRIHYEILDSLVKLNSVMSLDIAVWMTSNFINLVTTIFIISMSLHSGQLAVLHFLWFFFEIFKVYFIISIWSEVSDEANKSVTLIHDIWNEYMQNGRFQRELLYLQYICMRMHATKLKLSAYGFFPLVKTILHSIVASSTMFIIILIQLKT